MVHHNSRWDQTLSFPGLVLVREWLFGVIGKNQMRKLFKFINEQFTSSFWPTLIRSIRVKQLLAGCILFLDNFLRFLIQHGDQPYKDLSTVIIGITKHSTLIRLLESVQIFIITKKLLSKYRRIGALLTWSMSMSDYLYKSKEF